MDQNESIFLVLLLTGTMSGSSLRKVRRLLMDAPLEKIGDLTRRQLRAMIHEELGEDVDIGKDELDSLYTSSKP